MFLNRSTTTADILGILAASSGYAQDDYANDAAAPQREPSGLSVSLLDADQTSTVLSATIRIDNATNQDLKFPAGVRDPAWVTLHVGGMVLPGKPFEENPTFESNWPESTPLDERILIMPDSSRTIHVRFRLTDAQQGRHGNRFIAVTGSRGDHPIQASVLLVSSQTHIQVEGLWEGGG